MGLYTNKNREPVWLNRVKKFLNQPYKYIYQNAFKAGLISNREYPVEMFWGQKLTLPLADENSVLVYYCGSLGFVEITLTRFFLLNVKKGDVFYDVGANFGYYTALAEMLGAEVHSFEPNPPTLHYLRKNASPSSYLNEVAVADTSGELSFSDISASNKGAMSTLFPEVLSEDRRRTQRIIKVPAITLDDYNTKYSPPTFIKVDVENAESLVLTGARKLLTTHSPIIAMEIYGGTVARERTEKALSLMKEYGYGSYRIQENGSLEKTEIRLGEVGSENTFIFKK